VLCYYSVEARIVLKANKLVLSIGSTGITSSGNRHTETLLKVHKRENCLGSDFLTLYFL
jgi:hypothetical protein